MALLKSASSLESASSKVTLGLLIDSVYYAMRALEHHLRPQELADTRIMRGMESEPSLKARKLAARWLEEVESSAGRPIDEFDAKTLDKYLLELAETVRKRAEQENPPDRELGRRLLDELRAAVPV